MYEKFIKWFKKNRKLEFPPHLILPLLPSLAAAEPLPSDTFRASSRHSGAEACEDGTPKPTEAEPHRRWMPWPPAFKSRRAGHDSQGPSPKGKYGLIIHSPV